MRTIIIGDVHGCFDELEILLEKINYTSKKDELIFLGDILNKGPKSSEVIHFVKEGEHSCILGNHEWGYLKSLKSGNLKKGFKKLNEELKNYFGDSLDDIHTWLDALPLYLERKDFLCVHAGIAPQVELDKQSTNVLTRVRTWGGDESDMDNEKDHPWHYYYQGDRPIIYGHWSLQGVHQKNNTICLDSGCVWGGELSCLIWEERKIVSVPALKQYLEPY